MDPNSTGSNSIMMNQTDHDYIPEWGKTLSVVVFFCIWLPAIVLNLIVCWIILADKNMRNKGTNLCLLYLAVVDELTSIFNTPFNLYFMLHNDWIWSAAWCPWNQFLSYFFIVVSVLTLTAISFDRCLVLAKAFAVPQSKRVIFAVELVIVLLSILISSPVLYYYERFPVAPDSPKHRCMWDDHHKVWEHYYNVAFFGLTYVFPMIIMICCYRCVCKKLGSTKVIGEEVEGKEMQPRLHAKRIKMVKMLIVVVTSFMLCWLPTHIYFIVIYFRPEWKKIALTQYVYLFCFFLAMSNNMINPLLYFIYLKKRRFKQEFQRCIAAFCRCQCSQSDRDLGINRGFSAAAYSRKNGISSQAVTMETFASAEMADEPVTS